MNLYQLIRLDRRSKMKLIDQFEQQLMDAIQLEKISFKSPLPTVNSLEKTLHLPNRGSHGAIGISQKGGLLGT